MAVQRSVQGDTIEMIIFDHYGRQSAKLLDAVLMAHGNERLPEHGLFLPVGTLVHLPTVAEAQEVKELARIQELWH